MSRRSLLAAVLRGESIGAWPDDPSGEAAWIAEIEAQGITSLLHAAWTGPAGGAAVPPTLREAVAGLDRAARMRQLLRLSEARRIGAALAAAGIDCLWLKGTALAQWLYPAPHLRPAADLDVLFASHAEAMRAAEVLAPLGYRLPIRHIAGDCYVHELLAVHDGHGLELDLHWRLANSALFSERLQWPELQAASIDVPGLGDGARALGPAHAFLHACLHRAGNQLGGRADRLIGLYDLHLLTQRLSAPAWAEVVALAVERRIAEPCLDALHALARDFGTPLPEDVVQRLRDAAGREWLRSAKLSGWTYAQYATWREIPGLRARLRWLRQMLIGDLAHVRERYGGDGETRLPWLLGRRIRDGLRRWRSYRG